MKKRKYLRRLAAVILFGLILPTILAFHILWKYSMREWTRSNEDFYSEALNVYVSLMDRKIQELETFTARISAESREHDSSLRDGAVFSNDPYQTYITIQDLSQKYDQNDVTEWGIYFYDTNKILTSKHSYTPENFIYKYTGKTMETVSCAEFFSENQYSRWKTIFDSAYTEENGERYLFAGNCTKIGQTGDRAMIFYVLSDDDISSSLAIVGGEGISYSLNTREDGKLLLRWGDLQYDDTDFTMEKEWGKISGIKQKTKYTILSSYPQLEVTAYISGNSLQNRILQWVNNMKWILVCIFILLLVICCIAIYISYKPMYELTNEFDYEGGSEFDSIRSKLGDQVVRIKEQHMLILDLLINHLIYGVPISLEQLTQLGIQKDMCYYCVFVLEGYSFVNNEIENLTQKIEQECNARIFVTDWHEKNCNIIIAFLKEENNSDVQERLKQWMKESNLEECSLYTGKIYNKLENIQLSFRSCMEQMKKKSEKRQKDPLDDTALTPKKEQQKKLLENILAYLEINYRDPNLTQIQVADLFHISNYTLSRLFKNQVGVGFSEYLVAKRLEYAKELLLTSSYPVKEIAVMAGFSSENYFSRTFKLYEGVSPSSFRSQ